ncbi:hypothetical protein D3C72_1293670 [compost metagenome]
MALVGGQDGVDHAGCHGSIAGIGVGSGLVACGGADHELHRSPVAQGCNGAADRARCCVVIHRSTAGSRSRQHGACCIDESHALGQRIGEQHIGGIGGAGVVDIHGIRHHAAAIGRDRCHRFVDRDVGAAETRHGHGGSVVRGCLFIRAIGRSCRKLIDQITRGPVAAALRVAIGQRIGDRQRATDGQRGNHRLEGPGKAADAA